MSFFINREEGYFSLTSAGVIVTVVLILGFLLLTAFLRDMGTGGKEKEETAGNGQEKKMQVFSAKKLVFCAAALAFGFLTSYIKLFHMPWGGSVTLCSMLFVALIGYWYGAKVGLAAGFAYGLLQFIQGGGGYILSPFQVCFDYVFAFAALGLSGFFNKRPNGLVKGYLFAVVMRGFFHSVGGYLYWMDYMPDNFPTSLAIIYPIAYNYAYILVEALITVVILSIPSVKAAMVRVKEMVAEP